LDIEKTISLVEGMRVERRILVVDDDPDTYTTFKDILEPKGYQVSAASSGEEAIEMVRENKYDMIFIEMKLPIMDGLQTYLDIREINPQVVAVMMTAYYREASDLVMEALKKDAYTYLYKPFDMERVVQLVDEIYHRKYQRGEL
jgi:DNA-binding NtrC family response regulator